MPVSTTNKLDLFICPPPRRVERAAAPSTRPFDEFLRTTEVFNPAVLPPAPLWQVLERESIQRPPRFATPARLVDVLA